MHLIIIVHKQSSMCNYYNAFINIIYYDTLVFNFDYVINHETHNVNVIHND